MFRPSANAAAVTIPTRSPVNGPGPAPHTTASSSRMETPPRVITSHTKGMSNSPWARAVRVTRSASSSGSPATGRRANPAITAEVAVSTANTNTERAYGSRLAGWLGDQPGRSAQLRHPTVVVCPPLQPDQQAIVGEPLGHALAPLHDYGRCQQVGIQVQIVQLSNPAEPVGVDVDERHAPAPRQ